MAHFNPDESFEVLKDRTSKTIASYFPIVGKKNILRAKSVWVDDNLQRGDLRTQKDAKLKGRSWAVPVRAELELVDKATGKVKDTQSVTLAQIPKITNRYSYIVGGNEYQVSNQFRLKSGAYTRVRANGELTTQWNLAKGLGFDVNFDPRTKQMTMKHLGKGSNIALYPVLKSLGVDDDTMERQWGREIFSANKKENEESALKKFYKSFKGVNPPSMEEARKLVVQEMDATELRPDSTKLTLGKPFTKVDGQALMAGSSKLLRVARQEEKPDDRDALQFKDLFSAEDLVNERLERGAARRTITRKITNTLDKRTKIREIMNPDFFGRPIKSFFTNSTLVERPDQTNPASFLVGNRRTTLMGEGGISSELQLTREAKSINPSHMGFLDPIQTPESEKTGVSLQLATAARKVGRDLTTLVHDVKKGKDVRITPLEALQSNLAFPDQYRWDGKKALPISNSIKVADRNGEITTVKPNDVDYIIKSSKGIFDIGANMIPFLQNDQGNRTMMGVKQIEQAIGLVHREAPLVQTVGERGQTAENMVGRFVSQRTPIAGTVSRITNEAIYVKDAKGREEEIQIYDNFPLNDDKSKLHSEPVVKVGDKVTAGQLVADSNFTKNEDLALGTNLHVAYMPYKGYNFEDGIVISESAAKKLTSDHMFRQGVTAEKNVILNKRKFLAETAGSITKEQADKLDDFGVIKPGSVVTQGDVLIGVMKKQDLTREQKQLGMFSKSFLRPVKPQEVRWEKETPGVVARVVKHGKDTTVYVNSQAPATIGDKIVGRHGNKGIITHILPDHEMPKTKDGKAAQVLLNPTGIPTRINVGQVLETAAAKIAEKTGQVYKANNFDPTNRDYTRNLMKELEEHGIKDTEEMVDPATGKSFGPVLFGPQYILKLHHTAAKGLSARSRHAYDSNMTPQRGGPHGGQTMDAMGMYALLAHNSRENIREMQTYKCFLKRTMVETDKGPMAISRIVNQQLPVKVLSWNGEKLEYRSILNYWKRKIDTPLVQVKFMARARDGVFRYASTKCTEGHKFFTPDGEVEAKNLEGRKVLTPGLTPDANQWLVLMGSLLGDGCLQRNGHHFPAFQERHSIEQREYLDFKASVLSDFSNRHVRDYNAGTDGFNVGQDMCEWSTLAQPEFMGLYRAFYGPEGKRVPESVEDMLAPLSVAIWYQDDGSLTVGPRQRVVRLHTGSFDEEGRKRLIDALESKVGVRFTECNNNGSVDLRLGKNEDIDKFFSYIRPYVHPSMAYKLGMLMAPQDVGGALEGVLDSCAIEGLVEVPVLQVSAYTDLKFNDGKYLYNLEVEGNHNYFANRTLVGNSDYNDQFWEMIQSGDAPPAPKVPFVFKKFEGYLKGMGVDTVKEGNDLILQPLTDKKVLEMSNGELKNPNQSLRGKDLKPEAGGIFDTKVTGTKGISNGLGSKWSHIKLSERMPNPVFEAPIAALLGVNRKDIGSVVAGKAQLEGKTGPEAVSNALSKIDVNKEAEALKAALPDMRTSELNKANKKMKYLRALQKAGVNPVEAYTMKYLPVLPPTMRPVSIRENGDPVFDDLNNIYTGIGKTNYQLKTMDPAMPPEEKNDLHEALYDGIKGLSLTGVDSQGKHLNGIAEVISGKTSPKEGFFQQKVIGRRQDLSMRGTIVPEPSLSLDEVAIPRKAAAEIYKPFVVANLVNRRGYSPLMAQQKVKEDSIEAQSALEEVAAERPLLLKRDPVLHKYGVQAFKPRLVTGQAIKIHPLATTGYNADFDGDKMSAYVPVSQKAVKEAWKMMPSNNLFSPSTGLVMFKPTQESMQGLFKLTEMGKSTNKTFKTAAEAARAVKEGKIGLDDVITVKDLSGIPDLDKLAAAPTRTTVGRLMVYKALPSSIRSEQMLTDKNFVLDKGNLQSLLSEVASKEKGEFGTVSDKLKDLGNARSTGLSISLEDFVSDYEYRDKVMDKARKEEAAIRAKRLPPAKRDEQIVQLYINAGKEIDKKAMAKANANPNKMYDWVRSGARGSWDNYKQMVLTPMLVADTEGKPIPVPIDKSYSEGLDIGSYWASMYGARLGTISRAEGTWRPGLMSKQMMSSTMNQMVVSEDCGTKKGTALPLDERDILGRFTSSDIKLKKGDKGEIIPAGTLIDTDVINRLKNNRVTEVPVRTPLRCLHGKGLCAKCYGLNEEGQLHPRGANVGVIAAQALGEPATQLSMNSFHTGGVVGAKGTTAQGTFERVNQLLQVPKILPGAATLAQADGNVDKVERDPAGGWSVYISSQRHYVPPTRELVVKRGQQVKRGEALSSGVKNPREMLPLTGMPTVQRYITDELHGIYKGVAPVKRRNTETFVRAMTNLSKVTDPGDHEFYLRGDTVPATEVAKFNSQKAPDAKPIRAEPLLHGVSALPLEVQTDWLARLQATNLRSTILDASAERWASAVHSTHPIPGMAYGAEFGKGTPEEPWLY